MGHLSDTGRRGNGCPSASEVWVCTGRISSINASAFQARFCKSSGISLSCHVQIMGVVPCFLRTAARPPASPGSQVAARGQQAAPFSPPLRPAPNSKHPPPPHPPPSEHLCRPFVGPFSSLAAGQVALNALWHRQDPPTPPLRVRERGGSLLGWNCRAPSLGACPA